MAGRTMQITDLRIYPIKSCRGISLQQSALTRQGLKYDRRWMFIDATKDNKFVTIREKSAMTLIKTSINTATSTLEITFPSRKEAGLDQATISVPLEPTDEYLRSDCTSINVEIWKHETDAFTYNDQSITKPINDFFHSIDPDSQAEVKLVMKGPTPRITQGNGAPELLGRSESVNFPDVLPILVASEASLNELNSRLSQRGESDITIERFRPNIIVNSDSLIPWEEDEWRVLRINPPKDMWGSLTNAVSSLPLTSAPVSMDLDVSARCARCQVPNVDPETAVKHPKEPWSLLYSYRRVDEGIKVKPCFGMLCCPRTAGEVEVGMIVEVKEVMSAAGGKGEHKYIKGF